MGKGQRISSAFLLLLFLLVGAQILTPAASAREAAEQSGSGPTVRAIRTVRIGIGVLEPWKFQVNGKLQGAEIDMLEAVVKQLGLRPEYVVLPFKRVLLYMESGQVDLMVGLLKRPEREKYIYYVEPPYKTKSNKAFYVLKGNEHSLTKYDDLHKLRVGVKIGAKFFPLFDSDAGIRKDEVAYYEMNIQKLLKGRIDTFVITDSQGDALLKRLGVTEKIVRAPYVFAKKNPSYFGISRKSSLMDEIETIEEAISEMIISGRVSQIFDQYFISHNLPIPDYK